VEAHLPVHYTPLLKGEKVKVDKTKNRRE